MGRRRGFSRLRALGRASLVAAATAVFIAAIPGPAGANHSLQTLVSTGTTGGNGALDSSFRDTSADGSRALFETGEQLTSADTDSAQDVYQRLDGVTSVISTGPIGGNGAIGATFAGASLDASRVFFTTREALTSADTDSSQDLYERSGSVTTLLSTGPAGGNGAFTAAFNGASDDGTHVFFQTTEQLTSADTDSLRDLYERTGGTTTLASTGPAGGNGLFNPVFAGISHDGLRVFFQTDEALTADDTDLSQDVYQRSAGATTRLSLGPDGGNGTVTDSFDASFAGASDDGTHVFIETDEALVSADVDFQFDVYERSAGVTTLVSTGPTGGNGDSDASFRDVSSNGSRVFFQTAEAVTSGDLDPGSQDVYQRSGGATTLISTGSVEVGTFDAAYVGSSSDGGHVFFSTAVGLVPGDLDGGWRDIYDRSAGATTLISTGSLGGSSPQNAFFAGASDDGSRVFFRTDETLSVDDQDGAYTDVYERVGAATTLISTGPAGGFRPFVSSFGGISADGSKVFFATAEKLVGLDADDAQDVYSGAVSPLPTQPVVSPLAVSIVPGFRQTISATQCGSRGGTASQHGPPFALTSCNPPAYAGGTQARLGPESSSSALLAAMPGDLATVADEGDLALSVHANDVRAGSQTGPDYAPSAGGPDVTLVTRFRISDLYNGANLTTAATVADLEFPVPVDCAVTAGAEGSNCDATTTANALMPGAMGELRSTTIQIFRIRLNDAGANGVRGDADDRNFAMQGLYVP
jgi:hypothetical protein